MTFFCLTVVPKDLCTFCGEWVHVDGGDILHNGRWFCSTDCVDELEKWDDKARNRVSDWCPDCGYDRHEHAPDCAR